MSDDIKARRTGEGEITVTVGTLGVIFRDAEAQTLRDQLDVALHIPAPAALMADESPVFTNFMRHSVIDPPSRL